MKIISVVLAILCTLTVNSQKSTEKIPTYFGIQIRPVFPTQFIGESETFFQQNNPERIYAWTNIIQKTGYSYGATVRVGLTRLIALETGINLTHRKFDLTMSVPDSALYGTNSLELVTYDIPINALFYIKLSDQWYSNASLGLALNFFTRNIKTTTYVSEETYFTHTGYLNKSMGLDFNANFGFEFRTKKSGFFYLGGSGRVPFKPIFTLVAEYRDQGNVSSFYADIDGSFLSADFKYFFPNIRNKGLQFNKGPIVQ